MTKEDFNDLVTRLKRGDNTALSHLYPYQDTCIRMLVIKSRSQCDQDQAYDLFVDSVLDFRSNVLHDKVEFQNIKAYLRRICWNKWLAQSRTSTRRHLKQQIVTAQLYDPPDEETLENMEDLYSSRLSQLNAAMQQLSEQCQKVLSLSIAEELPMTEIAKHLNMASADVAKTTKSRCFKKLIEIIRKSANP